MDFREEQFLEVINTSASNTRQSIRQSIADRINSYVLIVSFIALAEATISAVLINAIIGDNSALWVRISTGSTIFGAFALLGIASLLIYRLFSGSLAKAQIAGERYLPYCHHGIINKGFDGLTLDERNRLFGTPLKEFSSKYSSIDCLYRQWVYENNCALEQQYELACKTKKSLLPVTVLTVVSAAVLGVGAFIVVFFA